MAMSSMTSMSMSMDMSPTATMTPTMSMSMSHDHSPTETPMDMSSHSMSMSMADMSMVFFTGHTTPLYSTAWTPTTVGQYAGTCIFLIFLAAIFRIMLAARSRFPHMYLRFKHRGDPHFQAQYSKLEKEGSGNRPWTVDEATAIAIFDVVLVAVSYLLMLAVMTMNVGYFLSVLGGTFLGAFVFGTRTPPVAH